jgi:hypothetical protein
MSVARAAAGWTGGALLALGAVAALGWWPASRAAGAAGTKALAAGCGIAGLGALVGALPVLAAVGRGGVARPHVVAGWAMALRFGATLAGLASAALGTAPGELPRVPLALAVGAAYGALLVFETRWTLRWLGAGGA